MLLSRFIWHIYLSTPLLLKTQDSRHSRRAYCFEAMPLCNIWRCPAPAVPDNDNRLESELETLRQRARTESARASALLSRQAKRLAPNQESVDDVDCHESRSALEHFQASWFTEQFQTTINDKFSYRPRARAVMSYLRALVSKMSQTFRSTEVNVNHMISINIVDDTNLKTERCSDSGSE